MADKLKGVERLQAIQQSLKAPKGQYNDHGGYNYRSCEDILVALKPMLAEYELDLHITDSIEECAGRVFVRASITLTDITDGSVVAQTESYAQHDQQRKGMDGSQISGACSSYARKYALNAMFLIDDVKDADATNDHKGDRTPVNKVSSKSIQPTAEEIAEETTGKQEEWI